MKKLFALMLALILTMATGSTLAEERIEWEKRFYLDEFELPTDQYYFCNTVPFVGKFSNSATNDSPLEAFLFYDKGNISLRLIEYGTNIVKNTYSKESLYQTSIMNPQGERFSLIGTMASGSDVISFSNEDSETIISALFGNGLVRFSISEVDTPTTKYLFNIEDSTGFVDVLPFSIAQPFSNGLALVKKGGLYGYIDQTGELVIPYQSHADIFSDGLAMVMKEDKCGFINTTGQLVIPYQWDFAFPFEDGYAVVIKDELYGVIDKSGKTILPCSYQPHITWLSNSCVFQDGLCPVSEGGRLWGYVNTNGEIVIPYQWSSVNGFSDGMAAVKKDYKYGYINTSGELIIPAQWTNAKDFSEGFAAVKSDDKWGFIDKTGEIIIPCQWESVYNYHEGFAAVEKDGKWGFIDKTGEIISPCQWESVGSFSNGLALVKQDGKYGYIDKSGNLVIPCNWNYSFGYAFSDKFATVSDENSKKGCINTLGELVVPCEYESVYYSEGYFTLLKDGLITILDQNLNQVAQVK